MEVEVAELFKTFESAFAKISFVLAWTETHTRDTPDMIKSL